MEFLQNILIILCFACLLFFGLYLFAKSSNLYERMRDINYYKKYYIVSIKKSFIIFRILCEDSEMSIDCCAIKSILYNYNNKLINEDEVLKFYKESKQKFKNNSIILLSDFYSKIVYKVINKNNYLIKQYYYDKTGENKIKKSTLIEKLINKEIPLFYKEYDKELSKLEAQKILIKNKNKEIDNNEYTFVAVCIEKDVKESNYCQ